MNRPAKSRDVAEAAGVSIATVSRALNHHASVAPDLAARVREAADRLGYRPNAVARSLRRQRSAVWALIFSDVSNSFYTSVARGVEDLARESKYSVLLCNSDEDPQKEASYLAVAEEERVAGVIISPHSAQTDISRLISVGIPVVAIDRSLESPIDVVKVHSRAAARSATDHLVTMGWSKPACISGPDGVETADERYRGYMDAIDAQPGLTPRAVRVPYSAPGGLEGAARLLDTENPPDAFMVANSALGLGVLQELRARHLRVGIDVGLIMFDESPWAQVLTPPVSVIAQPAYDIGRRAAELLLARMTQVEPVEPVELVLAAEIVVRGSSRRTVNSRRDDA